MNDISTPVKPRKARYDLNFKRSAVELWQSSGRAAEAMAAELDGQPARSAGGTQPPVAPAGSRPAQRRVAGRHHLCGNRRRLALCGRGVGPLPPPLRRLGDEGFIAHRVAAGRMANGLNAATPTVRLVHHSDRGVQYASLVYRQSLKQAGAVGRMSRRGNCNDNAAMESCWSALKRELVYRRRSATRGEARAAIFEWTAVFYNRVRPHSALGSNLLWTLKPNSTKH